jgi:MoaA/NifB/PqqE/SkfB family radical SAM enzyme
MSMLSALQNLVLAHPAARDAAIAALAAYRKVVHRASALLSPGELPEHVANYNQHRRLGPRKHLCFAPVSNLYFGTTGNITTCCFNRQHVLGVYPRQSIREAWEGGPAQALREAIARGDFSLGCQGCEALIHSGNFASVNAQTYDYFERSQPGWPSRMDFELSNTCNLACVMCNGFCSSTIRKEVEKRSPLRSPYDEAFLAELQAFLPHLRYAKFLGGEPFLIPLYFRIWDYLAQHNSSCQLYVQTNATRWDERIASTLERGLFSIGISLDSLNKTRYEQIRVHAHFEEVMANINRFAEYCQRRGTRLSLSVCPMRWNLEELPALLEYANSLQASLYFNVVYEPHYAAVWNLPSSELDYWMERLSNAEVVAQGSLGVLNRGVFLDFIRQLRVWKDEAEAREEMLLEQQDTPLSQLRQKAHIRCLSQLQQEGSVEVSDFTRQFAQVEDWTDSAQRIFCTYPAERMINALQLSHREGVTIR